MSDFEFEEGPSHEEIWKKISSENVNEKLEGLIEAASEKANTEQDPEGALAYLEAARDLVVESDDPTGMAHIYLLLGLTHWRLDNYAAAASAYELAADAAQRGLKSEMEVDMLVSAGRCYRRMRDFDSMRRNFELAVKLAVECDHNYRASLKAEFGRYLRKMGDLGAARVLLEEAYADEPSGPAARAASELVRVLLASGDKAGALEKAQEAFASSSYMNDPRGMNSSQYVLAQAMLANGDALGAMKELDALRGRQMFAKVKHKVRVDVLYAEALMRTEDWAGALPLFSKALPMLRREKLFVDLGKALGLRAECQTVLGTSADVANDLLAAVEAFSQGDDLGEMCSALLALAELSTQAGDWELAGVYALRVVDQVLMSFTPAYEKALGIYAVSLAKAGDVAGAGSVVSRLGDVKGLSGVALAHSLHASALLASGVRSKNLAAKAVKEYLLADYGWMAAGLAGLM
ncbi:MAG: MalT-like region [Actinomycetota bacterium]|jgi:tetratricopeptide (TPR) repeat protein